MGYFAALCALGTGCAIYYGMKTRTQTNTEGRTMKVTAKQIENNPHYFEVENLPIYESATGETMGRFSGTVYAPKDMDRFIVVHGAWPETIDEAKTVIDIGAFAPIAFSVTR